MSIWGALWNRALRNCYSRGRGPEHDVPVGRDGREVKEDEQNADRDLGDPRDLHPPADVDGRILPHTEKLNKICLWWKAGVSE